MVTLSIMPECFGTHEDGHPDCDGDEGADNALAQNACGVRASCIAKQQGGGVVIEEDAPEEVKPRTKRARPPTPEAAAHYAWFKEKLAKDLETVWSSPGQAPVTGQLYDSDHRAGPGYITVFQKYEHIVSIARVRLRADGSIDVIFPCPAAEAHAARKAAGLPPLPLEKLPQPSGAFEVVAKELRNKAVVGVAAVMAGAVRRRKDG